MNAVIKTPLFHAHCPKCHATDLELLELVYIRRPVMGHTDDGVMVVYNGNGGEVGDALGQAIVGVNSAIAFACKDCGHKWKADENMLDLADWSQCEEPAEEVRQ